MSCTVLRCHQCGTFQVHQQKKAKKWTCKMCNEKQSFVKVYAEGSGAECRGVVQSLNLRRHEVDQLDVHVARQPGEVDQRDVNVAQQASHVDSVLNLHVNATALTSDPGRRKGHNSMQATDQKRSKWSPFVEREESEEEWEADSDTDEENCRTVGNTNPAAQRRHAAFPPRSLSAAQRGKPVHKESSGFFHSTRDRKPSGWTHRQTHSGENHALYGPAQGLPLWEPANVPSRELASVPSREANAWTERDAFPARNGKNVEDTNRDSSALQCRDALGNQSRKTGIVTRGGASPDYTSFNPDARQEGSYPADSFQCGRNIVTPPVQQSTRWGGNSHTELVTRRDEHSAHRKVSAGSYNTSKWSQYLQVEEQSDDEDAEWFGLDLDATAI